MRKALKCSQSAAKVKYKGSVDCGVNLGGRWQESWSDMEMCASSRLTGRGRGRGRKGLRKPLPERDQGSSVIAIKYGKAGKGAVVLDDIISYASSHQSSVAEPFVSNTTTLTYADLSQQLDHHKRLPAMARIFITGSSDGIGQHAAKALSEQGHKVMLHARNQQRASDAQSAVPQAEGVLVADLRSIADIKKLAQDANATGSFDTVIHNAGIGYGGTSSRETTSDGISAVFAVNTLAPYILTCLMDKPKARMLYMSSDSAMGGDDSLKGCTTSHSYGNSKLHDVMLANAFARRWKDLQIVSMHPGWVRCSLCLFSN